MSTALAETLNPFAGQHAVSADPADLAAARRAADGSLVEFPYYAERFGPRARLFGASDGGWLLGLRHAGQAHATEQVLWLGRVLSSRGVPRWLLERHLELLCAELGAAERWGALPAAAAALRARREARLPHPDLEVLAAQFGARADAAWAARLPRMGGILAAAVVDEADGIPRAVASVEEWAGDAARFPAAWVAAVRETIALARRRLRQP
ncbi:MAG TPA: hypothetical protein VFQ45_16980 [Longimicrobium sp.]|nr:hypothetical protein [Longimicrobium sp.]